MKRFFKSFKYAYNGILYCLKTQKNMRFHFVAAFFVLLVSTFLDFSYIDRLILGMTIAIVIICEMINTAIETICDFITKEQSETIKVIKDIASAAVLVSAIFAFFVAITMFVPKFWNLIF